MGGLWVPAFVLPGWVRDVALALPTSWAMRGVGGVTWQGQDLFAVLPSVGMVAVKTSIKSSGGWLVMR